MADGSVSANQVGAGIQIPPNASRVLLGLGVLERVKKVANEVKAINVRRYADGKLLARRPASTHGLWM